MQTFDARDRLTSILQEMHLAILAFSGGVDSSLLLRMAAGVMGPNLIAVTAVSDTYPPGEIGQAKAFALSLGIRHRIIPSAELEQEAFTRNDPDRCYYCKRELFGKLREMADAEGIEHIIDGSNADDLNDVRPGRRAAREFGVRSPLVEAGMDKQAVRRLARELGLPMWDKPSLACLSSRVPYGTRISPDLLRTIHAAEELVRKLDVRQVRVRHHGEIARIEVLQKDLGAFVRGAAAHQLVRDMKRLGYAYVCLDLEGYRTGSMNEVLLPDAAAKG